MSPITLREVCPPDDQSDAARYYAGLERLVGVIEDLSQAGTPDDVAATVRSAVCTLTGADGADVALRCGGLWVPRTDESRCRQVTASVAEWAVLTRTPATIEDTSADARVPPDLARAAGVRSLAVAPIRPRDPLGAVAAYWSEPHRPTPGEVQLLQAVANAAAVAVQNARLAVELDRRVRDRTQELETELVHRRRSEGEIRRLSLTDDLTGLYNRRGFFLVAGQEWRVARRAGVPSTVVFADLDGLKSVNDRLGHTAGDALLRAAANLLRQTFRDADVIARLGGDEFAVFAPGCFADPAAVRARLDAACQDVNRRLGMALALSVGVVSGDVAGEADFTAPVARADAAMYADKRDRHAFAAAASGGL